MKLIERTLYLRQLYEIKNTPDIKIITGIRRAGKSKLLESFIQNIRSSEKESNIIHIDLTKLKFERLKQYHALNDYIESSYAPGVSNYVMIDEIQLCENFELVVNSLYSEQKYDIYITGSNAFLLSSDLSTLFTGRYIEIQVFPFSFKEFCNYFNEEKDIQKQLDRYIIIGGLAGSYPYKRDADKTKYIRNVFNTILTRDLVQKYKITNIPILKGIAEFLMDNSSNLASAQNISKTLNKQGDKTNHVTVGNYINYLCNVFLFYESKRFDVKGKEYLQTLNKYYLVDTGFRFAILGKRNMNWGRMIENVIYLELLRRGYEVYVGKLYQKEIDFVCINGDSKIYIQVSDDITNPETFQREIAPLLQIRDAYPKFLLARTRYGDSDYEGIKIIDVAEWLMQ